MEEASHYVGLGKNILWLGQDAPGGQFKYKLHGLPKDKGRREWPHDDRPELQLPPKHRNRRLPEIIDFMGAEITDEDDFQKDRARSWNNVFGMEDPGLPAADLEKVPEFEKKIRA